MFRQCQSDLFSFLIVFKIRIMQILYREHPSIIDPVRMSHINIPVMNFKSNRSWRIKQYRTIPVTFFYIKLCMIFYIIHWAFILSVKKSSMCAAQYQPQKSQIWQKKMHFSVPNRQTHKSWRFANRIFDTLDLIWLRMSGISCVGSAGIGKRHRTWR